MKVFQLIIPILLSLTVFAGEAKVTELVIISSLHGAHKNHHSFDYNTLFTLVETYQPDFVGVEIRPEDIGMPGDYLAANYPYEMRELVNRHKNKVFGVDWLGSRIQGKPIPADYWASFEISKLSAALEADQILSEKKPERIALLEKEQSLIVKQATPASLADGRYGQLCQEIDQLETSWLLGTEYMKILDFNKQRDNEIGNNIIAFIEANPGSRIVVVLGADHRFSAVETIGKYFGTSVNILPVAAIALSPGNAD